MKINLTLEQKVFAGILIGLLILSLIMILLFSINACSDPDFYNNESTIYAKLLICQGDEPPCENYIPNNETGMWFGYYHHADEQSYNTVFPEFMWITIPQQLETPFWKEALNSRQKECTLYQYNKLMSGV